MNVGGALVNVGGARFDWCIAELFSARECAGGLQSQNYIIVIITYLNGCVHFCKYRNYFELKFLI